MPIKNSTEQISEYIRWNKNLPNLNSQDQTIPYIKADIGVRRLLKQPRFDEKNSASVF